MCFSTHKTTGKSNSNAHQHLGCAMHIASLRHESKLGRKQIVRFSSLSRDNDDVITYDSLLTLYIFAHHITTYVACKKYNMINASMCKYNRHNSLSYHIEISFSQEAEERILIHVKENKMHSHHRTTHSVKFRNLIWYDFISRR